MELSPKIQKQSRAETRSNASTDAHIWKSGLLTLNPLNWHSYRFALGRHLFNHKVSPHDEREAKLILFPPQYHTSTGVQWSSLWLLLTTPLPTPQCTVTDCHLSFCTTTLWVTCGTTFVPALTLFGFEFFTQIFENIKLLTFSAPSLKVVASVPSYSAYLLLTSSTNSKLNSPTQLLILPLAYNTLGQHKYGFVDSLTLMTLRSCPPARVNCKPCYM